MSEKRNKSTELNEVTSHRQELCAECGQAMGGRATRISMFGKLKAIVDKVFGEKYDPFDPKQCASTPEDAERFKEYMDRYLMTHEEAVTMSARAPF